MKHKRRNQILTALIVFALLTALVACGQNESGAFRTLSVLGERRYAVIYRKDDRIAPMIDAAMEQLAYNGTLSALSVRWLGRNAITLKGSAPEQAEEAAEPTARTLIVGVEQDFDPMAYDAGDGALRGMSIELADALALALGWEVRYQPISPAEVGTQLASGNIDCALGFDPATVSASKYSVGVTYMSSEIVLAVRPDSAVKRLRDLKDSRIATVDDPLVTSLIKNDEQLTKSAAGAMVFTSPQRCLAALDDGSCAAAAMDRIMLEHLI